MSQVSVLPTLSSISAVPTILPPSIIGAGSRPNPNLGSNVGVVPGIRPADVDPTPSPTATPLRPPTSANGSESASSSSSSTTSSATSGTTTTTSTSSSPSSAPSSSSSSTASNSTPSSPPTSASGSSSAANSQTSPPSQSIVASDSDSAQQTAVIVAQDDSGSSGPNTVTLTNTASPSTTNSSLGSAPDTKNPSFLANKPLSISVFVVGGIIVLIILIIIATWALRKRRNSRLDDLADELSTDNLVGGMSFRVTDLEKNPGFAGGAASTRGDDVIDKMEAYAGARDGNGMGVGRSASNGTARTLGPTAPPLAQRSNAAEPRFDHYEQTGYPSVPVFVPRQMEYHRPQYAQPEYGQQAYGMQGQISAQRQMQAYDQGPNQYAPTGSYLPNPFESGDALAAPAPVFDYSNMTAPAQDFPAPRSGGATRKPPPPLLELRIPPTPASANANTQSLALGAGAPPSAVSLSTSPMQLPNSVNPANPLPDAYPRANSTSPRTPKRTPTSSTPQSGRKSYEANAYNSAQGTYMPPRRASRAKTLDHTLPPISVTPPLPEELPYVVSPKSAGSPKSPGPRPQLKVVNY